jgi:hypothetical protein
MVDQRKVFRQIRACYKMTLGTDMDKLRWNECSREEDSYLLSGTDNCIMGHLEGLLLAIRPELSRFKDIVGESPEGSKQHVLMYWNTLTTGLDKDMITRWKEQRKVYIVKKLLMAVHNNTPDDCKCNLLICPKECINSHYHKLDATTAILWELANTIKVHEMGRNDIRKMIMDKLAFAKMILYYHNHELYTLIENIIKYITISDDWKLADDYIWYGE